VGQSDLWEIPRSWSWTQLSEVGDIVSGGTPSTKEPSYWGKEVNWISPADLTGYSAKTIARGAKGLSALGLKNCSAKVMPTGSIHFSSRAPIGYIAISSEPLATNQGFKSLVPASGVLNEFIYYYLKGSKQLAEERASGTTFRELSGAAFSQLPLPLAPEHEQHRIVAKIDELFSELDKGVKSLKTARKQLKVYRQAVLKHAFEGKLTAQWREENKDRLETADQLLARIRSEREARYQQQLEDWKAAVKDWEAKGKPGKKPSKPKKPEIILRCDDKGVPRSPDGWLWLRFGDLCSHVRNGIAEKPTGNTGAKIFRISAVRPMEFAIDDVRYIDNQDGRYDEYFLQLGDLVFTRYNGSRAYVGVCAEYRSEGTHLFPDKLIQTKLAVPSILPSYIEKAVNCGASREFIGRRIRTTAGQSGVSGSDIKAIPVPICCEAEQAAISALLSEVMSRIGQLLAEIDRNLVRGEGLRQSILKKAYSGQLVEQDPNDKPASVLLERIRAEKAALADKPKQTTRRKGPSGVERVD